MLKLPAFPSITEHKHKKQDDEENGRTSHSPHDMPPADPYIAHKIQVFLRRLIGGFPGPDVDAFVSLTTAPSFKLSSIEAWLVRGNRAMSKRHTDRPSAVHAGAVTKDVEARCLPQAQHSGIELAREILRAARPTVVQISLGQALPQSGARMVTNLVRPC